MSDTPPPANKVSTDTTSTASISATALFPSSLSGAWSMVIMLFVLVWMVAYWFGAGKLSYDTSGSFIWAFLAFLFAPFYYPYYAFFVSKPAPPPMLGGSRDPLSKFVKTMHTMAGKTKTAASAVFDLTKK